MAPLLELSQLRFGYEAKTDLLQIDSFKIEKGEKIFVQGESGSGKSTFLSILMGLIRNFSGKMYFDQQLVSGISAAKMDQLRADRMGIIFQTLNLIPYLNSVENILLSLEASPRKRSRLKLSPNEEVGLLFEALQLDLDQIGLRPAYQLSVGQQQRVAVARSLIGQPDLIFADEPTSSLDTANRDSFLRLLLGQVEECQSSLVFVSHDESLKKYFDRSLSMKDWKNFNAS